MKHKKNPDVKQIAIIMGKFYGAVYKSFYSNPFLHRIFEVVHTPEQCFFIRKREPIKTDKLRTNKNANVKHSLEKTENPKQNRYSK